MPSRRKEAPLDVAIIGGGCAGITAAFELTQPELRGRYRVTLYQQGWRLGGKAASGRGAMDRIEEHGLHIWMGCYDNAFELTRACYAELGRRPGESRFADWRDAFIPDPCNGVADRNAAGEWLHWIAMLPPAPGDPGDPPQRRATLSVASYMAHGAALIGTLLSSVERPPGRRAEAPVDELDAEALLAQLARIARFGRLVTLAAILEAVSLLEQVFRWLDTLSAGQLSSIPGQSWLLRVLDLVGDGARSQLRRLVERDDEVRRLWEVTDFMLAILRGMVRHNLAGHPDGFDAINEFELREWLALHGASAETLDSAFVRALYDLFFAYEDGDPAKPRRAAGDALRSTLRMYFTYRGAFFWKLRAGMGDVVFAPFYEVLRRRGVRFEFFHRLEHVGLEGSRVRRLELDVQAKVLGGGEYRPLVDVDGLPCWPAKPDLSQLEDGQRFAREQWCFESFWDRRRVARRTLQAGVDFDHVVLAVGLGAIPHVCSELVAHDRRWREMVARVKTTATQAFQIWMRADMEALGWQDPPINLSGFLHPFTAFADMRQLIAEERWPVPPRTIAYFCGTLPTEPPERSWSEYPVLEHERVRRQAIRFLGREVGRLWPGWLDARGRFRWDLLVAPGDPDEQPSGAMRFESQFWTANVNPSDRYTLTVPGSSKARISPLDKTYANLTVAGDWTANGYNEGCVESAVMSGRLAAHGVSGLPRLEDITGIDARFAAPNRQAERPFAPRTATGPGRRTAPVDDAPGPRRRTDPRTERQGTRP